jgi:hypothetical protein
MVKCLIDHFRPLISLLKLTVVRFNRVRGFRKMIDLKTYIGIVRDIKHGFPLKFCDF